MSSLKARIVPLATCNSTTKDVMDPLTMTATIQNIGTSTIPAGMYCEIVCGAFTTIGTTTVDIASGASIVFGEGSIHTIPEAWAGQAFNVTATVWENNTKANQLDIHACSNLLTVNPLTYSVEVLSIAVNTAPGATCIAGVLYTFDGYEPRVLIRNNGTGTIPAGAYIEIATVGTSQKFMYLTTSSIPINGTYLFQGNIYTIPSEWEGLAFDVAASVWLDNTKTTQIGYNSCSGILNILMSAEWHTIYSSTSLPDLYICLPGEAGGVSGRITIRSYSLWGTIVAQANYPNPSYGYNVIKNGVKSNFPYGTNQHPDDYTEFRVEIYS